MLVVDCVDVAGFWFHTVTIEGNSALFLHLLSLTEVSFETILIFCDYYYYYSDIETDVGSCAYLYGVTSDCKIPVVISDDRIVLSNITVTLHSCKLNFF